MYVIHGPDWFGGMDGIRFSFSAEGYGFEAGYVTVHPVEQYRTTSWGAYIIDTLQPAIEAGSYDYFPTAFAAILLRARTQHVGFKNGAGIRGLVVRGQDGFFASNEQLAYEFHGLTDDGRFYIEAGFPIDAPIMMSTSNPAENTNPDAILAPFIGRDSSEWASSMLEYNSEMQRQLEKLDDARFTPALEILDALVESLQVAFETGD
jgi:hypothetical protein